MTLRWPSFETPEEGEARARSAIRRRGLLAGMVGGAALVSGPVNATVRRLLDGADSGGDGTYPKSVVLSGLQSTYDLLTTGPGVTSAPTKTWAAHGGQLKSQGVTAGTNGQDFLEFTSSLTLEGFDFRGLKRTMFFHGDGIEVAFKNCMFDDSCAFMVGLASGNNNTRGATATVTTTHCDHDKHYIGVTNGTFNASYPKLINTDISQYIGIFSSPLGAHVNLDHFLMQMGTGVPPSASHLEFVQQGGKGSFSATSGVFDISPSLRTKYVGGAGWTGVLSFGIQSTLTDCIFKGVREVDDAWSRVAASIAYNEGFAPILTNCLLGRGGQGYCINSNGGQQRPDAKGNNRDFNSGAILKRL